MLCRQWDKDNNKGQLGVAGPVKHRVVEAAGTLCCGTGVLGCGTTRDEVEAWYWVWLAKTAEGPDVEGPGPLLQHQHQCWYHR